MSMVLFLDLRIGSSTNILHTIAFLQISPYFVAYPHYVLYINMLKEILSYVLSDLFSALSIGLRLHSCRFSHYFVAYPHYVLLINMFVPMHLVST